jgi:histidine ammonia-lyase
MNNQISLTGESLTINEAVEVARHYKKVMLAENSRQKIVEVREAIENQWFNQDTEKIYGFNTGVGSLKDHYLSPDKLKDFQSLYIKSHSVGVGEPFEIEVVRTAILTRVNSFAKGFSGIRILIVDKLLEMLNNNIHPFVPQRGSVGASGDLAPLAHLASVLVGEPQAKVIDKNNQVHTLESLAVQTENYKIGTTEYTKVRAFTIDSYTFETIDLAGKEAMAVTNGATFILSVGVLSVYDAENLLKLADLSASLSLEAMMCEKDAFDDRLHQIRNLQGQITTADNIRKLVQGSQRMSEDARKAFFKTPKFYHSDKKNSGIDFADYKNRVQDRYSIRCIPQVHGASKDAFNYCKNIIERELNAATDNPMVFKEGDKYVAKSGGNFHGQPLAIPLDTLSIALAELANIADRRIFALINSELSYNLPSDLSGVDKNGLGMNTGLMIAQYTTAALVSENKILSHPASVDSVPTSGNQEDHVSMGTFGARKCKSVLKNTQYVIAIEMLCAIQALHLSSKVVGIEKFGLGKVTSNIFAKLANEFPIFAEDIYLQEQIEKMFNLIVNNQLNEHFNEISA